MTKNINFNRSSFGRLFKGTLFKFLRIKLLTLWRYNKDVVKIPDILLKYYP